MKRIIIGYSFLMYVFLSVSAQENQHSKINNLNIGGGYSHYVSSLNGYNLTAEFSLDLNRHLNISVGARYINASGETEHTGVEGWIKSPGVYSNLYLFVINKPIHRLKIGGGVTLQSYEYKSSHLKNGVPVSTTKSDNWINGNLVVDYEYNFHPNYLIGGRFGAFPIAGYGGFNVAVYFGVKL